MSVQKNLLAVGLGW